jgi:hypothetical protein
MAAIKMGSKKPKKPILPFLSRFCTFDFWKFVNLVEHLTPASFAQIEKGQLVWVALTFL